MHTPWAPQLDVPIAHSSTSEKTHKWLKCQSFYNRIHVTLTLVLPWHIIPFPEYLGLQAQMCDSLESSHTALRLQLCIPVAHSSTSEKTKPMNDKSKFTNHRGYKLFVMQEIQSPKYPYLHVQCSGTIFILLHIATVMQLCVPVVHSSIS